MSPLITKFNLLFLLSQLRPSRFLIHPACFYKFYTYYLHVFLTVQRLKFLPNGESICLTLISIILMSWFSTFFVVLMLTLLLKLIFSTPTFYTYPTIQNLFCQTYFINLLEKCRLIYYPLKSLLPHSQILNLLYLSLLLYKTPYIIYMLLYLMTCSFF